MTGPEFFVLTGLPRSGTTYLSAVLYRPPRVVTLSDPAGAWKRFYRDHGRSERILDLFRDFYDRILAGEPVPTLEGTDGFEGKQRVDTWNQKKVERKIEVEAGYALGMKNPEVFLEHLDLFLEAGLRCVVSVRHPVSIINSWVKKGGTGDKPKGFANGVSIAYRAEQDDPVDRRIALHNHLCQRIVACLEAPGMMLVRHEDWYRRPGLIDEVCDFIGISSPGELRPAPIAPDLPILDPAEQERILSGCVVAEALGYPVENGALVSLANLRENTGS